MEDFIHDRYGWCYFVIEPDNNPLIFNLYVDPQHRRKGHARRYLNYVINRIREYGYTGEIEIQAKPKEMSIDRNKLVSFYEKMALKVIGT
ncbi:GNAT family N-acetyltransferase [Acinetobacter sp.]|uniref:GNAT family N-acetyltransferase n=1 Tax=Acinetobacter sp. TaxID=472 RepID=UPI003D063B76